MTSEYTVITSSTVNVKISSTVSSFGSERRFQKDITISELKVYLNHGHWHCCLSLDVNSKEKFLDEESIPPPPQQKYQG